MRAPTGFPCGPRLSRRRWIAAAAAQAALLPGGAAALSEARNCRAALADGFQLDAWVGPERLDTDPRGVPLQVRIEVPAGLGFQFAGPVRLLADGRGVDGFLKLSALRRIPVAAGDWVDPAQLRPGPGPAFARDEQAPFGLARWTLPAPPADGLPASLEGLVLERAGDRQALVLRPAHTGSIDLRGQAPALHWRWQPAGGGSSDAGELVLAVLASGPWRLVDEQSRWRYARGADQRAQPAGGLLELDDRIPADALLAPAPVPTRVRLEATLPPRSPHFEVRLPPVRHQSGRVALPSLRFERGADARYLPVAC